MIAASAQGYQATEHGRDMMVTASSVAPKEDGSKNAFYKARDEKWPPEATLDKDSFLSNVMGLSNSFKSNVRMQQSCESTRGRAWIQTFLK
eukprot:5944214-Karenia_brevis.AAC.1